MKRTAKKLMSSIRVFKSYNFNMISPPISATIFTSHNCNLGCAMCWRKTESGIKRLNWESTPTEKWKETIIDLKNMGCNKIEFSGGGEPLLDKNFKKLAKLAKDLGMKCTLTTNGTLLDREMINFLNSIKWDTVMISLDGPDEETNNKIRGWGFKKVIENIKSISETDRSFSVFLQTVILPINYKKFPGLLEICKKYKLNGITFLPFCDFKHYTNNFYTLYNIPRTKDEFDVLIASIRKEFEKLNEIAKQYRLSTNIGDLLNYSLVRRAPYDTCYNPWLFCVIDESGNVIPCCQLSNINKNFQLGNIKESNIREIWYGEKFKQMRKNFKKRVLYAECNDCIASKFNERIGLFLSPIRTVKSRKRA